MIDFIKLDISYLTEESLLSNPILRDRWKTRVTMESGEVIYPKVAKIDGLKFICRNPDYRELHGSLHKYFNTKNLRSEQNYDQFTRSDLAWVVNDLRQRFGVIADRSRIRAIEYGVNLAIQESPTAFISEYIVAYKNKPISRIRRYGQKGYFTENEFTEYSIKIYDKSRQYEHCPPGILRFEVHARKSRIVHQYGINSLADLLNAENYNRLLDNLWTRIQALTIIDEASAGRSQLSRKEEQDYLQYCNPKFWENMSPSRRHYHKKKYVEFIQQHDLYHPLTRLHYYFYITRQELIK